MLHRQPQNSQFKGCSKRIRCKATETGNPPRRGGLSVAFYAKKYLGMEAYKEYVGITRDEVNAADDPFSTTV